MSSNPQITLRNGKTLTCTTSVNSTRATHEGEIVNMEINNENVNEQAQSEQGTPNSEIDSQRVNDGRVSDLQSEMAMLKAMMEKLLEQNEERNRQTDTNAATSSFAVRSSTGLTETNATTSTTKKMKKITKTHQATQRRPHYSTPSKIYQGNCRKQTRNSCKPTFPISEALKTNITNSSTSYLTISDPSPTSSQRKIKYTSSRASSAMKPLTFGKPSPSTQPPLYRKSCNYSERSSQKKI